MTSKVELVSIVIPALNEAGNILEVVTTIHKELKYPNEIIVVDGNSTDGTQDVVRGTGFCRLIIEPRRGYGRALKTGMENAKGNVIIMVDGDGTYEVRHIGRMLDKMVEDDADLVLATRMYDPNKAMGFFNFVGNKIITFCFDFLYSQYLSDTQSGFRAISHDAMDNVKLVEGDMAFATEMLIKFTKKNYKIVEVKSTYKIRIYGKPKLQKFKSTIEIFTTMVKGLVNK
ncbi:MAG: glycosyltransferase family 2 protein [Nitrososphaerota archaeon]|jgi:glycosyltransferase involved in cell wall biosynthesis|nr:glycosyltransferase family 2 protein [Nitrososphaerota archaeon]